MGKQCYALRKCVRKMTMEHEEGTETRTFILRAGSMEGLEGRQLGGAGGRLGRQGGM